jgi:hypothetical protein
MHALRSTAAVTVLGLFSGCSSSSEEDTGGSSSGRNCSDFSCQGDAQAWHNSHPEDGLDADRDGIACEHLPRCALLATGNYRAELADGETTIDLTFHVDRDGQGADSDSIVAGLARWDGPQASEGVIARASVCADIAWLEIEDPSGLRLALFFNVDSGSGGVVTVEGGAGGSGPAGDLRLRTVQ